MKNLEGFGSVGEKIEISAQLKLNSPQYYDICLFGFFWAWGENKSATETSVEMLKSQTLRERERERVFSFSN